MNIITAKNNDKQNPYNENITELPIFRETNKIRFSFKKKPSNPLNDNFKDRTHPQITSLYTKGIQTPILTKRKQSYDIIPSPLVSTNDDDVVTLSEIMTPGSVQR